MRSYALLVLALVLHARAASIPAPTDTEKLPTHDALDDVSLDNNDSEQELIDPANVKEVQNNLRNSVPENVPVKIIEEQPVIKTVALKEDSNDYVPENDDSINIKRVQIDLNNPGPPQRQEHDSQNPGYYVDKERAVAAIRQSIAQSENTFKRGIQDVTQKFKNYFANNEELSAVQKNIQNLKESFNAEVAQLTETIHSSFKPQKEIADAENLEKVTDIKEVENNLKTLQTSFKTGVDMLTEGVELLSILKEEDDENKPDKISGKADNENIGEQNPAKPGEAQNPSPAPPSPVNPMLEFMQQFSNSVTGVMNNLYTSVTGVFTPQTNGTSSTPPFNPANIFQNFNFPNPFQNQNQAQTQNQGSVPAGAQSDDAGTTATPNLWQQISNSFTNIIRPPNQTQSNQPQNPNLIVNAIQNNPIVQTVSSWIQPKPTQPAQQTNQASATVNQPAAAQPAASQSSSSADQGVNSVPVAPSGATAGASAPASPPKPAKESQTVAPAQPGPIQQLIQNSPIVQGITSTVQRIQGLSNPSKPRDTPKEENSDAKGHSGNNSATGDSSSSGSGIDIKPEAAKEPQATPEVPEGEKITEAEKKE